MKKVNSLLFFLMAFFTTATLLAAVPDGYYSTIVGYNNKNLKDKLQTRILNGKKDLGYADLWSAFFTTDVYPIGTGGSTKNHRLMWDMYSDNLNNVKYFLNYSPSTGKYTREPSGSVDREHCVPKSWWGSGSSESEIEKYDCGTDLHQLYPSDGSANSSKSNFPLGYVASANFNNGSCKCGTPKSGYGGGSTSVFEPAEEYKGDFARTYFYVATAYQNYDWKVNYMFNNVTSSNYLTLSKWAYEMLLDWSRNDPVSDKEIERNDAVYGIQGNRNPFIDYPELAEYIWGNKKGQNFVLGNPSEGSNTGGGNSGDGNEDGGDYDPSAPLPTDPASESFESLVDIAGKYLDGATYKADHYSWTFNNCGIFSFDSGFDQFLGKLGVRLASEKYGKQYTGSFEMSEDKVGGIGTLTFYAGQFSKDVNPTFIVSYSTNGGVSWTVIDTITLKNSELTKFTYSVNKAGNIRIRFALPANSLRVCIDEITMSDYVEPKPETPAPSTTGECEGFEAITSGSTYWNGVSKTGDKYTWSFTDAGVFTSTVDKVNGKRGVRMGKTSSSVIETSVNNGVGVVSFYAAKYGTDAQATLLVQYSTDGTNWNNAGSITINSQDLKPYSVTVNKGGKLKVRFQQTEGKRFNIDDVKIEDYKTTTQTTPVEPETPVAPVSTTWTEDFESMSIMSAYKSGSTVAGTACKWYLYNFGTFATTSDRRNGKVSLRAGTSETSFFYMAEDKTDGVGTVNFSVAKYSTDADATLYLYYSTDGGQSWKGVGYCTVSSTSMVKYSAPLNISGNVRIGFQQNGGARFNIDDIVLGAYSEK